MQLHVARLCLDCSEVHDAQSCPVCGSEAFAYLKRWVPATERRLQPRPASTPEADVYRELIAPKPVEARPRRLLRGSVFGVAAIAAASWLWQRSGRRDDSD